MKAALVFSAVLAIVSSLEDQDVLKQWTQFQAEFSKNYRSSVEVRERFAIFKDNLNTIQAHNQLYENGQSSFTMGVNQFADWKQSEFLSFIGRGLPNKTETFKAGKTFVKASNFVAPGSVDWRNKGIVTAVKDQKNCGGCWAFSSTGSIEGQLALKTKKLVSLSEQNLIDCSMESPNNGCNGGLMTSAFDYVMDNGIDSEKDYPFKEYTDSCKDFYFKPVTKLTGYVEIPAGDEEALLEAVATIGPISVGVATVGFFQFYKSGIFDGLCFGKLNHAVLVVGYGRENGKDFYIVKNSWNANWGENGYIRIVRNYNKCGIANMASYPVIASGGQWRAIAPSWILFTVLLSISFRR